MNILQINSSARSTGSASTRLADALVARVLAAALDAALEQKVAAANCLNSAVRPFANTSAARPMSHTLPWCMNTTRSARRRGSPI